MDVVRQIKDTLSKRSPILIKENGSHNIFAAVLIPIFMEEGEYRVLFTERTHKVAHHKGQISFPGGAIEKGDRSLKETALRESYEEIGLLIRDVEVLGQVDDTTTVVSNFIVRPFVGLIPYPYPFKVNSKEVESLITIPFQIFLNDDPRYKKNSTEVDGFLYQGAVYEYNGSTIWGATARIMDNFSRILSGKLSLPEGRE